MFFFSRVLYIIRLDISIINNVFIYKSCTVRNNVDFYRYSIYYTRIMIYEKKMLENAMCEPVSKDLAGVTLFAFGLIIVERGMKQKRNVYY